MNATDYCSSNSTISFDFYGIDLDPDLFVYCETMVYVRQISYLPLLSIMNILCIILLIITLSGQIKEDYKYFIFNSVILNLLFGGYMEVWTIFFSANNMFDLSETLNSIFYQYINDLTFFATFPIAVNRFLIMYFSKSYT